MFRILFCVLFLSGVMFADVPKCAEKVTLDELRAELSKAIAELFEEGMYEGMDNSEIAFLKEEFNTPEGRKVIKMSENLLTNVKFNKIITDGKDGNKVICRASLADFNVSREVLERIVEFIMIRTAEYVKEGSSKDKTTLATLKAMIKPIVDEASQWFDEIRGETIHYTAQRSDDGYLVVEILEF